MRVRESMAAIAIVALMSACGGGGRAGLATGAAAAAGASASSMSSAASSATASSVTSPVSSSSSASSVASSSSSLAPSSSSASSAAVISSLGADGWASYGTNNLGLAGTTGGDGAAAGKIYTVTNRNELIQAFYGGTATINADGSFSGTLDSSRKIIYVSGTISLNMNKALVEQTADNYVSGSCASTTYGYASEAALWTAYYAAYAPPYATLPTGNPESARVCAAALQKKVVYIGVPSNTSIIGIGATAKIIHGDMVVGSSSVSPVDNIVIRNVAFEDAFDFFPQWDPTDSGGRWNSAYDNVSVMYATHVWLDHCTFSDGARIDHDYPSVWGGAYAASDYKVQHHDGMSDITKNANYVTVSNNHYHDHDKSLLVGGTDTAALAAENPSALKITFHHNYFQNLKQRQPRVRYGMVHIYNNYFSGNMSASADYPWLTAWVAGQGAKLYVENNVVDLINGSPTASSLYSGSSSSSKVTSCAALSGMTTAYCSAYAYQAGTLLNGSAVDTNMVGTTGVTISSTPWASAVGATPSVTPSFFYTYSIEGTANLATTVPANAGVGKL